MRRIRYRVKLSGYSSSTNRAKISKMQIASLLIALLAVAILIMRFII